MPRGYNSKRDIEKLRIAAAISADKRQAVLDAADPSDAALQRRCERVLNVPDVEMPTEPTRAQIAEVQARLGLRPNMDGMTITVNS